MKHKLVAIILVSTLFGLMSGIVGTILARVYILEKAFNLPLFGELNLDNQYSGSSVIISNPRKVVVDQDLKVVETARSLQNSIYTIHKKIEVPAATDNNFSIRTYYSEETRLASAFVLTADGWLVSPMVPAEMPGYERTGLNEAQTARLQSIFDTYVVLDQSGRQLPVKDIAVAQNGDYAFFRIDETGLPVRKMMEWNDFRTGESVFALNHLGQAFLTNVAGKKQPPTLLRSSDDLFADLLLSSDLPEEFHGSFIFNLSGDLAALAGPGGDKIEAVAAYTGCMTCVLKGIDVATPFLGLYYIDLSALVPADPESARPAGAVISKNEKGIAVIAGSPAATAGLQANDIILDMNGQSLNGGNDLSWLLSRYQPGDKIVLTVQRGPEKIKIEIELGSK